MSKADKILKEKNPFHREIYAMGYEFIKTDFAERKIVLIGNGISKSIDQHEIQQLCMALTIKRGVLPDGRIHEWIAEADGSAKKFRDMIKP